MERYENEIRRRGFRGGPRGWPVAQSPLRLFPAGTHRAFSSRHHLKKESSNQALPAAQCASMVRRAPVRPLQREFAAIHVPLMHRSEEGSGSHLTWQDRLRAPQQMRGMAAFLLIQVSWIALWRERDNEHTGSACHRAGDALPCADARWSRLAGQC